LVCSGFDVYFTTLSYKISHYVTWACLFLLLQHITPKTLIPWIYRFNIILGSLRDITFLCCIVEIFDWPSFNERTWRCENSRAQWKIISITSMDVDFWEVKYMVIRIYMLQKWSAWTFVRISYAKMLNKCQSRIESKFSGFHSSFRSRNDFTIKIILHYRCR
jgi:hypothetical protein